MLSYCDRRSALIHRLDDRASALTHQARRDHRARLDSTRLSELEAIGLFLTNPKCTCFLPAQTGLLDRNNWQNCMQLRQSFPLRMRMRKLLSFSNRHRSHQEPHTQHSSSLARSLAQSTKRLGSRSRVVVALPLLRSRSCPVLARSLAPPCICHAPRTTSTLVQPATSDHVVVVRDPPAEPRRVRGV